MRNWWEQNGPPAYITLAAAHGWKPTKSSGKKSNGEYGDLRDLERMFSDTGGVIQ